MRFGTASGMVLSVLTAAALWGQSAMGQQAPPQGAAGQAPTQKKDVQVPRDPYQRSLEIFELKTTAKSGWQRGEEIYYIKCWFCHNQYVKTGPLLKDIYKRPTMFLTGGPVTEERVREKVLNGGPNMPGYRYALDEAAIADLMAYIRSDKCCFDAENPPPNPRYRAGK